MLNLKSGFHFAKIQNNNVLIVRSIRVLATRDHKPQPKIARIIEAVVEIIEAVRYIIDIF